MTIEIVENDTANLNERDLPIQTVSSHAGRKWERFGRCAPLGACYVLAATVVLVYLGALSGGLVGCSTIPNDKDAWKPDPLCKEIDRLQQPQFYIDNCKHHFRKFHDNRDRCYALVGALGGMGAVFLIAGAIAAAAITTGVWIENNFCSNPEIESDSEEEGVRIELSEIAVGDTAQ